MNDEKWYEKLIPIAENLFTEYVKALPGENEKYGKTVKLLREEMLPEVQKKAREKIYAMKKELRESRMKFESPTNAPLSFSFNHGYFQLSIGASLRNLNKYLIVTSVTINIGETSYTPDISIYAKRPVSRSHDIIKTTEMPLAAIEILAPTQGTKEILDTFATYFSAGIKSCWLVEPVIGAVAVYSGLDDTPHTFSHGEVIDNMLDIHLPIEDIFI